MSTEYLVLCLVVVGVVGFVLERVGKSLGYPRVEALGAAVKSVASDVPGFVLNLIGAVKGAKK